jgi:hypothetical protein
MATTPSSLVIIVLDSCRFDSVAEAAPRAMQRLGPLQRRYSYASWTAPSHYNLLMGLLPHAAPRHVFASNVYKREYTSYRERLGIPDIDFSELVPQLYLPSWLRQRHGYLTQALVSLPVLNRHTPLATGFDHYELMPRHNDMAAMIPRLRFESGRPTFVMLNVGETHYPYALPDEPEDEWPRLSGLHGAVKGLDRKPEEGRAVHQDEVPVFFEDGSLPALRMRQIEAVRYLDTVVAHLYDVVPAGTWIVITSDHGELFGESGYFGHGPIIHEKVFEVPFIEGRIV